MRNPFTENDLLIQFARYSILPSISIALPRMFNKLHDVQQCRWTVDRRMHSELLLYLAIRLKIYIERDIFRKLLHGGLNKGWSVGAKSGAFRFGTERRPLVLFRRNILDYMVDIISTMEETDEIDSSHKMYVIIPQDIASLIPRHELHDSSSRMSGNGKLGYINIARNHMDVFASNTLPVGYIFFGMWPALSFNMRVKVMSNTGLVTYVYKLEYPQLFGEIHYRRKD